MEMKSYLYVHIYLEIDIREVTISGCKRAIPTCDLIATRMEFDIMCCVLCN